MELNEISDEDIVKGIVAGHTGSHRSLQNKYAGKLLHVIYNLVGNRADAEEILNEVLYKIISGIDTYYQAKASFKTWIYQIAIYSAIDFLRTQKQPVEINGTKDVEKLVAKNYVEGSTVVTPQIAILREVLEQMGDRDRTLLEMRYMLRLTNDEIASYLKLNTNTVRVALHRARKRLKQKLISYPEFKSYIGNQNKKFSKVQGRDE